MDKFYTDTSAYFSPRMMVTKGFNKVPHADVVYLKVQPEILFGYWVVISN